MATTGTNNRALIAGEQRVRTLDAILKQFPNPAFRRLTYFYLAHSKDGEPPCIGDIDLMEIYKIADRLVLIDLEGDVAGKHRFKWRLAGTALRQIVGLELTGQYLDDVAEEKTANEAGRIYCQVLTNGAPHAWRHKVMIQAMNRNYVQYDRLLLPLADEEGHLRHLIGVYSYGDSDILDQVDDINEEEIRSLGMEN